MPKILLRVGFQNTIKMKINLIFLILSFLFLCSSCDVNTDSLNKTDSAATTDDKVVKLPSEAPTAPSEKVPDDAPTAPTDKVPDTAPTAPIQKVPSNAPSAPKILSVISVGECEQMKRKEFNCNCGFEAGGITYLVTDWGDGNACFGNKGEANALYPDWEERDYKKELKELANNNSWINASGNSISYFGKPLEDYKYEDPVEFLTDVILASGKDISVIPSQTTTGGAIMKKAQADNLKAIAKAKAYKSNGVDDVLTVQKFDNRTYDVYIRYKRLTQREGEADDYEGKIVLLKHRTNEILETKKVTGYCGC